jgi:RNAse (barnase) inhibitor barstar
VARSELHHGPIIIEGEAFLFKERLHDEFASKLGFPKWYGRNLDALLDCLSSIDDPSSNLCANWETRPDQSMVLQVRGVALALNAELFRAFIQIVSDANCRLREGSTNIRIWLEFQ